MIVRAAQLRDAPALARLHAHGFDRAWARADFEQWLRRETSFGAIARRGVGSIGMAMALTAGEDAELLTIATHPATRRRGVAGQLLQALDAEAVRRGLRRWVLEVACNNLPARRLYERFNFVEIGVRKGYYSSGQDHFDGFVLARPVGFASA